MRIRHEENIRRVKDLKVGESAYVTSWAIQNHDGDLYLSPDYTVSDKPRGTTDTKITRTAYKWTYEFKSNFNDYKTSIDASKNPTGTFFVKFPKAEKPYIFRIFGIKITISY